MEQTWHKSFFLQAFGTKYLKKIVLVVRIYEIKKDQKHRLFGIGYFFRDRIGLLAIRFCSCSLTSFDTSLWIFRANSKMPIRFIWYMQFSCALPESKMEPCKYTSGIFSKIVKLHDLVTWICLAGTVISGTWYEISIIMIAHTATAIYFVWGSIMIFICLRLSLAIRIVAFSPDPRKVGLIGVFQYFWCSYIGTSVSIGTIKRLLSRLRSLLELPQSLPSYGGRFTPDSPNRYPTRKYPSSCFKPRTAGISIVRWPQTPEWSTHNLLPRHL